VTYEQIITLAQRVSQAGTVLTTPRGAEFTVGVYLDCPFFVPASTGRGRSDGRKAAERFLDIYNATGSLRPTDYVRVTRNASYFIGLIRSRI